MFMENAFENDSKIIVALDCIGHNYHKVIKSFLLPETKTIAMVKANAYGHGIVEVSEYLEKEGIDYLGVFSASEAYRIRNANLHSPILIFGIPHHSSFQMLSDLSVSLVVSSPNELKEICDWTDHHKKTLTVHFKVDTGMSRLGFFPDMARKAIQETLRKQAHVAIEGLCTHFAESSAPDKSFTLMQGETFKDLLDLLNKDGICIPVIHAANSGAILHYPEFHFSAVRPGILLYGISPDETQIPDLRQALSIESYVGNIKTIPNGSYVSYGRTYQCSRLTTIAVIPLGYADGLPLGLSNQGNVIINNHLCPIIGSICMNQFMVDMSDCPDVEIGSKALILGRSQDHSITVQDIAKQANTLPYDVLCRLPSCANRKFTV
jgi:alanine racemase